MCFLGVWAQFPKNLWFWSASQSVTACVSHSQLTCLSMCTVNLWLCGVSKHNGSYTIEAVFISVILQSCLLCPHHVVLTVATAWGQFRDTKLLLQHWKSRAITCRDTWINMKPSLCENILFSHFFIKSHHPHHQTRSIFFLLMVGLSVAESTQSLWCGKYHWYPLEVLDRCSRCYSHRWHWAPWSVLKSNGAGCFGWWDWVVPLYPERQSSRPSET